MSSAAICHPFRATRFLCPLHRAILGMVHAGFLAFCLPSGAAEKDLALSCDIDPLIDIPAVFALTPEALEAQYPAPKGYSDNPFFKWLTQAKDRAIFQRRPYSNISVDLSILGGTVPVEEVVVDFAKGKLNGITFSIYNRGDAGQITPEEFKRRLQACDEALRKRLASVPSPRRADPAAGLLASGWTWFCPIGLATIEKNPEADSGHPEYLKMRIAPRDATGPIATAIREQRGSTTLTQLKKNAQNDGARTLIQSVPMVDQGPKGYCVVAASQRLFEYYGISCDQHQIAKIAGTDAKNGTSSDKMMAALQSLDRVFHLQFKCLLARFTDGSLRDLKQQKKAGLEEFQKSIEHYVGDGIPLLWSLGLGKFPEQPPLSRQAAGGHMRLIIGFDKENLYFTDSWGAGHELGSMSLRNAFDATTGLFVMHPTVR
jgi:Peptidase_C39 like family